MSDSIRRHTCLQFELWPPTDCHFRTTDARMSILGGRMRELRKDIDLTKKGGRTDAWRDTDRVQIYEFHGREPRQVQEFLTKVYAENEFKSVGERAHFRTDIRTNAYADVGLCKVRHAAPFLFESTTPRDTFLVFSCAGGAGTLQADDGKISVHGNLSVPISATGI